MVKFVVIIVAMVFTNGTWAAAVTFQWQTVAFNSTLPGLNNGDLITVNVFADNGGPSLFDQTWNNADISSATLTAGSYVATYFPPTNFGDPVFQTDVSGNVSQARLVFSGPLNPLNFDTLGEVAATPSLARNQAQASTGQIVSWGLSNGDTFDASQWTVGAVPVPAAVWLFGSGLLGLIGIARKKRS